jgi:hypothetical protein
MVPGGREVERQGLPVPAHEPVALGPAQHGLQRAEQLPPLGRCAVGVSPAFGDQQPADGLRQPIALQRAVLVQRLLDRQPRVALEALATEVVVQHRDQRLGVGKQLTPARRRQQRLALPAHQPQPPQRGVRLCEHP